MVANVSVAMANQEMARAFQFYNGSHDTNDAFLMTARRLLRKEKLERFFNSPGTLPPQEAQRNQFAPDQIL